MGVMRTGLRIVAGVVVFLIGAVVSYVTFLRSPILTWGATDDEASSTLPGDDLLPEPDGMSTRAIGIDAPATDVYPWLTQIGPAPRGGAYTYDWIENLLGLGMHSTDEILEEFQHPRLGDAIDLGPNRMLVQLVDPPHAIAWRSADGNWVWSFVMIDDGNGGTRLISRNRFRLPRLMDRAGMLPMEPGSLLMERKMLRGIKARAEKLAQSAEG